MTSGSSNLPFPLLSFLIFIFSLIFLSRQLSCKVATTTTPAFQILTCLTDLDLLIQTRRTIKAWLITSITPAFYGEKKNVTVGWRVSVSIEKLQELDQNTSFIPSLSPTAPTTPQLPCLMLPSFSHLNHHQAHSNPWLTTYFFVLCFFSSFLKQLQTYGFIFIWVWVWILIRVWV